MSDVDDDTSKAPRPLPGNKRTRVRPPNRGRSDSDRLDASCTGSDAAAERYAKATKTDAIKPKRLLNALSTFTGLGRIEAGFYKVRTSTSPHCLLHPVMGMARYSNALQQLCLRSLQNAKTGT